MKYSQQKILLVILIGLGTGILLSGSFPPDSLMQSYQNITSDNSQLSPAEKKQIELSERIKDYEYSENISEDPQLEQFKLYINTSEENGNLTKYDGPSWNHNAILRGKLSSVLWRDWNQWEGPGNYSTAYKGFEIISFPNESTGASYLEQEVEIPETGFTILSVVLEEEPRNQVSSCDPNIELKLENIETGQEKLLVEKTIGDSQENIRASLDDFKGEKALVRYVHRGGEECSSNYVLIEKFAVTHYFN